MAYMQRRSESRGAGARFQLLWQTVETAKPGPADNQIRGQLLNLLAAAHQSRETRLFQMTQSVPGLVWSLLIIFAPVATPAAHSRAESRGSRPSKAAARERLALRWSKPDSNPPSRSRGGSFTLRPVHADGIA